MPLIKLHEPNVNQPQFNVEFVNSESKWSVDERTLARFDAVGIKYDIVQADKHVMIQIKELTAQVIDLQKTIGKQQSNALEQTGNHRRLENDYKQLMEEYLLMKEKYVGLQRSRDAFANLVNRYKDIKDKEQGA